MTTAPDAPALDKPSAAAERVARLVAAEAAKGQLRFLTCGSVDDGKSTLLGRLLYDAGLIYEDQLATLLNESRGRVPDGELDFSLLLDGLLAEREQGITIDVAWRYVATDKRKFIIADCPGHEQYTRNMATGASRSDAALLLVDARKGPTVQTRRHLFILALMGVRHVAVAVNKMDLVGYEKATFDRIAAEIAAVAERLGFAELRAVPVSALKGDNVARASAAMPWYDGPPLLTWLEELEPGARDTAGPFRLPVQWVCRAGQDFRGFAGLIVRGRVAVGDRVLVARSGLAAHVARIVTADRDLEAAEAGASVILVLDRELDVARGDVLCAEPLPAVADQIQAHLLWTGSAPLVAGRRYLMRLGTDELPVSIMTLKHAIDVETGAKTAVRSLATNGLAVVTLATDRPIAFDPYAENRDTGGFVLIDRMTHETVAAGMIDFPLRRATAISWQHFDATPSARAAAMGQTPVILWFTGLSGAGKSTIANIVDRKLLQAGRHSFVLDGDNVRHGLNKDLGFTEADRVENIRRVAEVARLMADAGLIVLVCLISPFARERALAREIAGPHPFFEVFVDAPLAVAESRDPKGLYAKARAGALRNFTGIDAPYEAPVAPDLHLRSDQEPPEALANAVLARLGLRL